jgi:hypothetical protein
MMRGHLQAWTEAASQAKRPKRLKQPAVLYDGSRYEPNHPHINAFWRLPLLGQCENAFHPHALLRAVICQSRDMIASVMNLLNH